MAPSEFGVVSDPQTFVVGTGHGEARSGTGPLMPDDKHTSYRVDFEALEFWYTAAMLETMEDE